MRKGHKGRWLHGQVTVHGWTAGRLWGPNNCRYYWSPVVVIDGQVGQARGDG